jgi:serine/threonine protein kinase
MTLADHVLTHLQSVACWPEFTSDRYTVVAEIGRGGMGSVYLARDEALGREVAIKAANAVSSSDVERRVRNEAHILASLEHPGIVPIHDVGRLADGRLFYVMQRVRGETLLAQLPTLPDLADRLRIFERICDPVAFAHAHGVIHRDLKPENVMLGAFGEVLVMDWGIAKIVGDAPALYPADSDDVLAVAPGLTDAGTVLGTRGFMAPEQASGAVASVDARADVYGLGALLFTLLTGAVPPGDADAAVAQVLRDRTVPRPLRAVCARALAPSPPDRYPDVRSLADDVARFRAERPVTAHKETLLDRAGRLARTYRTPILLILAYMLMRAIVAFVAGR